MSKRKIGVACFSKWKDLVIVDENCKPSDKIFKGMISWPPSYSCAQKIGETSLGKLRYGFGDASFYWTDELGGFGGIWMDTKGRIRGLMGHLINPPSAQNAEFNVFNTITEEIESSSGFDNEESPLTLSTDNTRIVDVFNKKGQPNTLKDEDKVEYKKGLYLQQKLKEKNIIPNVRYFNSASAHVLAVFMRDEGRMIKRGEQMGVYVMDAKQGKTVIKSVPGNSNEDITLVCTPDCNKKIKLKKEIRNIGGNQVMVYELDSQTLYDLVGSQLEKDISDIREIIAEEDAEAKLKKMTIKGESSQGKGKGKGKPESSKKGKGKTSPKKKRN